MSLTINHQTNDISATGAGSVTIGGSAVADQLDKIFHHGIEAWKTDIQAIKNDNPKPS